MAAAPHRLRSRAEPAAVEADLRLGSCDSLRKRASSMLRSPPVGALAAVEAASAAAAVAAAMGVAGRRCDPWPRGVRRLGRCQPVERAAPDAHWRRLWYRRGGLARAARAARRAVQAAARAVRAVRRLRAAQGTRSRRSRAACPSQRDRGSSHRGQRRRRASPRPRPCRCRASGAVTPTRLPVDPTPTGRRQSQGARSEGCRARARSPRRNARRRPRQW